MLPYMICIYMETMRIVCAPSYKETLRWESFEPLHTQAFGDDRRLVDGDCYGDFMRERLWEKNNNYHIGTDILT